MPDFDRLLREIASKQEEQPEKRPLPEAQIMTLRELFAVYGRCPFKPGDLVTVRNGVGGARGAGHPHLVLEVRPEAEPNFQISDDVSPGSHVYGARRDIRVLVLHEDEYVAFWGESWVYEPYHAA